MARKIVLVCLLWAVESFAQCGEGWYGGAGVVQYGPDEYPSVEDSAMRSLEEVSDEYYPVRRQRTLRSSRYEQPEYGYSGNGYREERYGGVRKSHYDVHKARRKYDTYGKSSRSDYALKGLAVGVNAYERKKTSRAAKYAGDGGSSYGKTTSLTFKAVPPKANCAQNLLIGCTPTVTRVPCSASAPYEASYGQPYYPPPPAFHHQSAPAQYDMPHPAYGPPPPPSYYPPPPAHHADHPAESTYGKPHSEGAHGYGPSYKAATAEEIPGFAAPVRENLSESTKVPIISAFSKPTDSPTGSAASGSAGNGTRPDSGSEAATTANPMPVLTPAPEQKEDNDAFWDAESNVESSTDVTEGSTARSSVNRDSSEEHSPSARTYRWNNPHRTSTKMNSFIAITLLAVVGVAVAAPPKYGHAGGHHAAVVPGPAVVHTYPAVAPVVKCGHNLLVSCDPHHQAVPCKAAAHGHHGGYHGGHHAPAPAPAYHHAPAPHHYAPAPAYHGAADHGEYRAKKHHGKKHHKGKSADSVGEAIDSSSEMM
uniref:VM domain-containing protein n=1 Tax=Anopheles dirus TaxID=7168 RepID=A0A182MZ60_9DIPT